MNPLSQPILVSLFASLLLATTTVLAAQERDLQPQPPLWLNIADRIRLGTPADTVVSTLNSLGVKAAPATDFPKMLGTSYTANLADGVLSFSVVKGTIRSIHFGYAVSFQTVSPGYPLDENDCKLKITDVLSEMERRLGPPIEPARQGVQVSALWRINGTRIHLMATTSLLCMIYQDTFPED